VGRIFAALTCFAASAGSIGVTGSRGERARGLRRDWPLRVCRAPEDLPGDAWVADRLLCREKAPSWREPVPWNVWVVSWESPSLWALSVRKYACAITIPTRVSGVCSKSGFRHFFTRRAAGSARRAGAAVRVWRQHFFFDLRHVLRTLRLLEAQRYRLVAFEFRAGFDDAHGRSDSGRRKKANPR
jgi:hypothetical protein